ncbi:MAG: CapA family protein [Cellvibrionaceae bacterium]
MMKYLLLIIFLLWHSTLNSADLRLYNLGELLLDYDINHYPKVMMRIKQTSSVIKNADVVFGNVETTVEPKGLSRTQLKALYKNPSSRVIHHTPTDAIDILAENLKVNLFSMANNHSFDLGKEGIIAGINHMEEKRLVYAGIGRNNKEATGYKILNTNGKKIAFFAFTNITLVDKSNTPLSHSIPTETSAGLHYISGTYRTWNPIAKKKLLTSIKELKDQKKVDFILVSGHIHYTSKSKRPWSANGQYPTDIARNIIDAGADAFLVEGPHSPKGFEIYKKKPIFYGVGNLIFNTRKNVGEYEHYRWYSYIADTVFKENKLAAIKIIPLISNRVGLYGNPNTETGKQRHLETRGFAVPVSGKDAQKVLQHIQAQNKDNAQHDFITNIEINGDYAYWPNKETYLSEIIRLDNIGRRNN